MLVLHATLPVTEASREEAVSLASDLAAETRSEPGVIEYRVATDVDDPTTLRFFERYEDEAAMEAHMESNHFREFQGAIAEHLGGDPTLVRFDVDETTELM